jgi:molecular chaperone GrpE
VSAGATKTPDERSLFQRLRRWLDGDVAPAAPYAATSGTVAEGEARPPALQRDVPDGNGTDGGELAALRQGLAALEKQISRAGREQLKANSLAEAQLEQLAGALELLRVADTRRDAEVARLHEQARGAQAAARLEVVRAVLPALDGLDEALRSGQRLLEQAAAAPDDRSPALLARLRGSLSRLAPPEHPEAASREALREAMAAWLVGLTFVRQRLLDALAAEGVRPMEAQGQPFDPQHHIALEVVPAGDGLPPGSVAAELRRGYLVHDRVLRHAEVAVSRQSGSRIE